MPQIILQERTANLARYTFFTRDVAQYKNMSLSHSPGSQKFLFNNLHQSKIAS